MDKVKIVTAINADKPADSAYAPPAYLCGLLEDWRAALADFFGKGATVQLVDYDNSSSNPANWHYIVECDGNPAICHYEPESGAPFAPLAPRVTASAFVAASARG